MDMSRVRILLADDREMFREGLSHLLSEQRDFDVVGEVADGEEALRQVILHRPQIVLMNLHLPVLDGTEVTRRLHNSHPDCRVILLAANEEEHIYEGLRAGAVVCLLNGVPSNKLFEVIRASARYLPFTLVEGMFALDPPAELAMEQPLSNLLTDRELEILRLMDSGASNKDIAEELDIAEGTVKNHVASILGKLEVSDRIKATLKGRDLGLI